MERPEVKHGGRLQRWWKEWEKIDLKTANWLKEGIRIELLEDPQRIYRMERVRSKEEVNILSAELKALMEKEAVEERGEKSLLESPWFYVKEADKNRPILDMKRINQYVKYEKFKMENLQTLLDLIEPGDYICQVDIKSAYQLLPLHKESQKYATFQFQGKFYQYKTIPFGLSSAPRIFSKIMKTALTPIRRQGIRCTSYIDDIAILGRTKQEAERNARIIIQHLINLAFIIHEKKSVLEAMQVQTFLGFKIDTIKMKVYLPQLKIRKIKREIMIALKKPMTMRKWASLAGLLNSTYPAVRPALINHRYLQKEIIINKAGNSWETLMEPTEEIKTELMWWITYMENHNGKEIRDPPVDINLNITNSDQTVKIQDVQQTCEDTYRQHDGTSLHQKPRGNSIEETHLDSERNLEDLFGGEDYFNDRAHSREGQYISGPVITYKEGQIRFQIKPGHISSYQQDMGTCISGFIGNLQDQTSKEIFQLETGPRSNGNGCVQTIMERPAETICIPTYKIDPEGDTQDPGRKCKPNLNYTALAITAMVPSITHNAQLSPDINTEGERNIDNRNRGELLNDDNRFNRVEHLREAARRQGLSEEAQELVAASERPKTQKQYRYNFRLYKRWCMERSLDPYAYDTINLTNFLAEYSKGRKSQSVKAVRSAISATWLLIHPEQPQAGDNYLVKKLIKGKKESEPPTAHHKEDVWDIQLVLDNFRNWGKNENLTLPQLTYKTVMLTALVTMCRPRSELSQIDLFNGVKIEEEKITIIITKPKAGREKIIKIDRLLEDPIICPVETLLYYMKILEEKKAPSESSNLFRTISKPHSNASEGTIAAWIKKTLEESGIDIKLFKPHSTRSASSTNAKRLGASDEDILKRAGWTRVSTFKRYYYRPKAELDIDSTLPSKLLPAKKPIRNKGSVME